MKSQICLLAGVYFLTVGTAAFSANTEDEALTLQQQVEALQKGQESIQKDLDEIKKLLREGARAAPSEPEFEEQVVSIGPSPFKGASDATVTLIEYSDYQCPFCSRHYRDVMPALVEEYVETGKLKYVMRENPIASIHSNAVNASLAALCAKEQDRYWEMHNIMFDNQRQLGVENLKKFAAEIGLDTAEFDDCLDSQQYKSQIDSDLASASELSVRGTPNFVLGLTDPENDDRVLLTKIIRGARSLPDFKQAIEELLSGAD